MDIERRIYTHFLKDSKIVFDFGAHVGEFSSFFADIPTVQRVVAIEPSKKTFEELTAKTASNPKIERYEVAINDRTYDCVTRFKDCRNGTTDEEQPIRYQTYSDFLAENSLILPDFIKMDIEGAESIVLQELLPFMEQKKPTICVEVHAQALGDERQSYNDNPHFQWAEQGGVDFNAFKAFGYKLYRHKAHSDSWDEVSSDSDWTPESGFFGMYIFEPL